MSLALRQQLQSIHLVADRQVIVLGDDMLDPLGFQDPFARFTGWIEVDTLTTIEDTAIG
jgi:hypothetical protein